jgi:uncharacterized protein
MIEVTSAVLVAGALAVFIMAVSKAGFGGGLGALSTPILALTVTAPQAVAIMLPLLLVMDAMGLWTFRKVFDQRVLKMILPGALIGTLLGWLLFGLVDAAWIKLILAIECLLFAGLRLRKSAIDQPRQEPVWSRGLFFGSLSSLASFIAHAGSPPILQFTLPLKLNKEVFVGTMTVFFSFVNASKLVPYAALGLLNFENLKLSLMLLPIVPIGFWVGYSLLKKLKQNQFDVLITAALFLTGAKLLWDAVSGLS